MPKFAVTYHLAGTNNAPHETIEADDIQQAAEKVGARFAAADTSGAIVVPFDQEMYAIPKTSVAYCHLRQVIERRRAQSSYTWEEEEGQPAAEATEAA